MEWGLGRGGWTLKRGVEGKMRRRRPAESLCPPRPEVRLLPIPGPRGGDGRKCVTNEEEKLPQRARGEGVGGPTPSPPSGAQVLPPAHFGSVKQITVRGLGPCGVGWGGGRRGRAAGGVTAIGTGCAADCAPAGGGGGGGWLLTQPAGCYCCCCSASAWCCRGASAAKPHSRVADSFGANQIKTLPQVGAVPTLGDSSV